MAYKRISIIFSFDLFKRAVVFINDVELGTVFFERWQTLPSNVSWESIKVVEFLE
jgi:hypothetical protein